MVKKGAKVSAKTMPGQHRDDEEEGNSDSEAGPQSNPKSSKKGERKGANKQQAPPAGKDGKNANFYKMLAQQGLVQGEGCVCVYLCVCVCVCSRPKPPHTHTHAHAFRLVFSTHTRTHMHPHTHTVSPGRRSFRTYTHVDSLTRACAHMRTRTLFLPGKERLTHTHVRTHTRARTHAHREEYMDEDDRIIAEMEKKLGLKKKKKNSVKKEFEESGLAGVCVWVCLLV